MNTSVYVHIPFCKSICSYCDFCKVYYKEDWVDAYLDALENEINLYDIKDIYTLYIGGGTPTSLNQVQLERLLKMLSRYNVEEEYSIEINPETLDYDKLVLLKQYGINRLSIGVQTFNENLLQYIERKHTKKQVLDLYDMAIKLGFDNISMDFMYNLPHQTMADIQYDLDMIKQLGLKHISYYSLILEEGTILKYQNYMLEDDYEMSEYIKKHIHLPRYEVSNYAYNNYESKHNLVYWHNEYYYGFGLGSHSYIDGIRYHNTYSLTDYLKGITKVEEEILSKEDMIFEHLMVGLRLKEGVSILNMNKRYDIDFINQYHNVLDSLISQDYMYIENDYLKTTDQGFDLLDELLLKFL